MQQTSVDEKPIDAPGVNKATAGRLSWSGKEKGLVACALAFFLAIIVKDAWLSDAAYITFRTVDNLVNGYGLTWNIDERVQAYTHPLWMLLLTAVYFCVRRMYVSALLLCVAVSLAAVVLLARYLACTPAQAALGIVMLAASKSFVDYSTSGLENPLTNLLLVLFALVYFSGERRTPRTLFWLTLLAALAALNRMDTLVLLASSFQAQSLQAMLLGGVPFVLWELFSLWYYGFLFPNTAYAKLNTGIDGGQLFHQGIGYFLSSGKFDPWLFLVIATSVLVTVLLRAWKHLPFLIGIGLYMLYTIKVGGDFMAGRYLKAPLLIAVILLARSPIPSLSFKWLWIPVLAVVVVLFGLLVPNSRWHVINSRNVVIDGRGVSDERAVYLNTTGIRTALSGVPLPNALWAREGIQASLSHQKVVVVASTGFFGFEAGPNVHIVDSLALCDPLLARLPALPGWRIGHFYRQIPGGYVQTLESGSNHIQSKELALYYEKLHYVTSGPLFDIQRIVEIWKLNTGAYNYLLNAYNTQQLPKKAIVSPPEQVAYDTKSLVFLDTKRYYGLRAF